MFQRSIRFRFLWLLSCSQKCINKVTNTKSVTISFLLFALFFTSISNPGSIPLQKVSRRVVSQQNTHWDPEIGIFLKRILFLASCSTSRFSSAQYHSLFLLCVFVPHKLQACMLRMLLRGRRCNNSFVLSSQLQFSFLFFHFFCIYSHLPHHLRGIGFIAGKEKRRCCLGLRVLQRRKFSRSVVPLIFWGLLRIQ